MPTVEWAIPFDFITPLGPWTLNADSGYRYLLDQTQCRAGAGLRVTEDPIPQQDGSIIHAQFREGYSMHFGMQLWKDDAPACDLDLRHMWDDMMAYTTALTNPSLTNLEIGLCRVRWTPSGTARRMLDRIRLLEPCVGTVDANGQVTATFSVHTEYPYAIDLTQTETDIAPGFGATITNLGTAPTYPVFKIDGPCSSFTLTNSSYSEALVFDSTRPGASAIAGGHYLEIDTFRNTAYLDGSGANYKAGIDIASSDFWRLEVGSNIIAHVAAGGGGTVHILWNSAWA